MPERPRQVKLKKTGTVQATRLQVDRSDEHRTQPLYVSDDDDIVLAAPARHRQHRPAVLDDEDDDGAGPSTSKPAPKAPGRPRGRGKAKALSDDEVGQLLSTRLTYPALSSC
jgi:hypothetical protein